MIRFASLTAATALPRRVWAIVGLALLGIADATYLTWLHYSHARAACAGIGDCEVVNSSRYATLFGVPVAAFGLGLYLVVFGLGLALAHGVGRGHLVRLGIFGLALVGFLFSMYLTYIELFVLHAICPYCVLSAVVITAILALSIPEALSTA